jgi:membrane-bound serine protease (ClpP class)
LAAVVAGVLYFMPYYLSGLAANWEILTFLIGLALIGVEVFVIPGFGIVGILGIACTFSGLILVMLDNDWFNFEYVAESAIYQALGVTVVAFIGSVAVIAVGLANLTKTRFYKKVALNDTLSTADGFTAVTHALNLVGKIGRAHTVMRPSGKILIGDELYDATARNTFIEKGARVVVVSQEGTSLKVVEDRSEEAQS